MKLSSCLAWWNTLGGEKNRWVCQETKQSEENLPDIYFLSKEIRVVQVSNCTIHCIAVPHLYHGCSRFAFHEFNLRKEKSFSSTHGQSIPIRFPSQQKDLRVKYSPSPRCHRDKRYWRCGLRSSSGGPGHTTWRQETQRGYHTLQEAAAGAHNQVHSFFHHVLSLVDPCGGLHIHSSHHIHGNHLLKTQVMSESTLARPRHIHSLYFNLQSDQEW